MKVYTIEVTRTEKYCIDGDSAVHALARLQSDGIGVSLHDAESVIVYDADRQPVLETTN